MACKPKHKDSLSNTHEVMVNNGAMDKWYNIRDLPTFRSWNSRLSRLAGEKYGVGTLYGENESGTRAIPNLATFGDIDQQRKDLGIYESGERKTTTREAVPVSNETSIEQNMVQKPGEETTHVVSSPGLQDLYLTDEEYNCK